MTQSVNKCGVIAIVGRPNVGKSTLMNRILQQKISITSSKPQTTRHQILGIKTTNGVQSIYVDTPGMHQNAKTAMNRYMNRAAGMALKDVDLVLFVVDATKWTLEDDNVLKRLQQVGIPVILVVNKVDRVDDKETLLPLLQELGGKMNFCEVVPVSAKKGSNIDRLENAVTDNLPEGTPLFPDEQITDKSQRFLAAEIVREKLMRRLQQELPYALTVEIESFKEERALLRIHAIIWVERDSQKMIVIGKGGQNLKEVGKQARLDMQKLFQQKVHLELWVKVKEGWSDNESLMKRFGYNEMD